MLFWLGVGCDIEVGVGSWYVKGVRIHFWMQIAIYNDNSTLENGEFWVVCLELIFVDLELARRPMWEIVMILFFGVGGLSMGSIGYL